MFVASAALNQVIPTDSYISGSGLDETSSSDNVPYSSRALGKQVGPYDFSLMAKRLYEEIVIASICETIASSKKTHLTRADCQSEKNSYFVALQQYSDIVSDIDAKGTDTENVLSPVTGCRKDGSEIHVGLRIPEPLIAKLKDKKFYEKYFFHTLEPYGNKSLKAQKIESLYYSKAPKMSEPVVTPVTSDYEYYEDLCNEKINKKPMELVRSSGDAGQNININVKFLNDPVCMKIVLKKKLFSNLYSRLTCKKGEEPTYLRARAYSTDGKLITSKVYGSFSSAGSVLYQLSDEYSDTITTAILNGTSIHQVLSPDKYVVDLNHQEMFKDYSNKDPI